MTHYVIIGNSVAGTRAATVIRAADPIGEITILTADDQPFYLRPKLADYVAGKTTADALAGRKPEFYDHARVSLRLSTRVTGVDTRSRQVLVDQKEPSSYDKLLIASGARPARASFPGSELGGVLSLKTLADAEALKSRLATAHETVVVGEGLMGLEMARACRAAGAQVTYLVKGRSFWPSLLDDDAANLVEQRLTDAGVELRRGVSLREAVGSEGQIRYVITSRGAKLPCDLLCMGVGLQPDTAFLQGSGILLDNGIVVNQQLATRVPDVFAAGDCVQQRGGHDFGWLRAWEQGAVAGANMTGSRKSYKHVPVLSMQVFGLDLLAIGLANPPGTTYRCLGSDPSEMGVYKRLTLKGDTVVGALMVGDVGEASAVEETVRQRAPISQVDPTLPKRLFDPYYWGSLNQEILCPVCKFGIRLGTEAKTGDLVTCPICGEEFTLESQDGRLSANRD